MIESIEPTDLESRVQDREVEVPTWSLILAWSSLIGAAILPFVLIHNDRDWVHPVSITHRSSGQPTRTWFADSDKVRTFDGFVEFRDRSTDERLLLSGDVTIQHHKER